LKTLENNTVVSLKPLDHIKGKHLFGMFIFIVFNHLSSVFVVMI